MKIIRQINFYRRLFKLLKGSLRSLSQLPHTKNLQPYFEKYRASGVNAHNSATLDIGCGTIPRNPFSATTTYGIDIRENLEKNIKYADLTVEKIPYPDAPQSTHFRLRFGIRPTSISLQRKLFPCTSMTKLRQVKCMVSMVVLRCWNKC